MQKKWFCSGLICMNLFVFHAMGQAKSADAAEFARMQDKAVQFARSGDYPSALNLLKQLQAEGDQSEGYWQDYIAILCWAGQEKEAIHFAEERYQKDYQRLPTYVLKALEGAYKNQKRNEQSIALLEILLQRGEVENRVRYAEQLMEAGRLLEADQAYDAAGKDKKIPDYRIAYSRSIANLKRSDFIAADQYLARAKDALEGIPDQAAIFRDLEAHSAALLIRAGETGAAARILKKYVEADNATPNMKADYLIALRYSGKSATAEFERLGPDWMQLPLYGLQNMGDAYFRQKQYRKAEKVYDYILSKNAEAAYVRAGRAYCMAMRGRERAAIGEYEALAAKHPEVHDALAADGLSYVSSGRTHMARKIFSMLGTNPAEKSAYQYQYANALAAHGEYHESQRIYQKLGKEKSYEGKALASMAVNKVRYGLNGDAKKILDRAAPSNVPEAEYAMARIQYSERTNGNLFGWFTHSADYKGNDNYTYGISRENYIGNNFFMQDSITLERLRDDQAENKFTHFRSGLSYRYDRGRTDVSYVVTNGGYRGNALELYTEYELNDLAKLTFRASKRPHSAAGAVSQEIDEEYRNLRWEQRIDGKNTFTLEYEWAGISDGNGSKTYNGEFMHTTRNTPAKIDNLLFNYGWSGYDHESPYYESPRKRISFGMGFSQKWLLPKKDRSWEWAVIGSWGYDNEEPTDFSPSTRLELVQELKANQSLTLGAEYGWRTKRLESSSALYHGYYQIDFSYNWWW